MRSRADNKTLVRRRCSRGCVVKQPDTRQFRSETAFELHLKVESREERLNVECAKGIGDAGWDKQALDAYGMLRATASSSCCVSANADSVIALPEIMEVIVMECIVGRRQE